MAGTCPLEGVRGCHNLLQGLGLHVLLVTEESSHTRPRRPFRQLLIADSAMPARDRVQHLRVAVAEDGATYSVAPPWFGSCDRDVRCFIRHALMLSRRPATWLRLLPLALVIPGCDGGQTSVSPTSVPAPASSISLTCVLGSTDCAAVMQGQTLTFTARPGDPPAAMRSAVLNYGDGSPQLELGAFTAPATASHEYMRLGSYTARLEVTTVNGETRSATVPIKVDTLVTASIATTNHGNLNVEAVAEVTGAPVLRYEWSFEPFLPRGVTTEPRALFAYPAPGSKAVERYAVLVDGRVILASAAVIVGREHEG